MSIKGWCCHLQPNTFNPMVGVDMLGSDKSKADSSRLYRASCYKSIVMEALLWVSCSVYTTMVGTLLIMGSRS